MGLRRDSDGGSTGNMNAIVYQEEYTQCDNLLHVDDAWGRAVGTSEPDEEKGDKDDKDDSTI